MKIHEVVFDESQIVRKMPKRWKDLHLSSGNKNIQCEFGRYCELLYESLIAIKHDYAEFFDANNSWKIDDYIKIFNLIYGKILNTMFQKKKLCEFLKSRTKIVGPVKVKKTERFKIFEHTPFFNPKIYVRNRKGKIVGFTDEGYKKVSYLAKKLFMLEKMCAFTTRKIWKNEITKFKKLNLKTKYKIIVKTVFADEWRHQPLTRDLKKYYKERIYSSASLIDNETKDKIFNFNNSRNTMAILLMDYDDNCFVCASKSDNYSEETIDGENPILLKSVYSEIMTQSCDEVHGKIHKLYADAVETLTPIYILKNVKTFSEINLKNAKPKAVISPNKQSVKFSQEMAEKLGVPFIYSKSFME